MPLTLIFAIIAAVSTVCLAIFFWRRLQWMQKARISFPDTENSAFNKFMMNTFGGGKIEKHAVRVFKMARTTVVSCYAHARSLPVVSRIKNRADHIFGKKISIPKRETSSVFLKSIALHKRKMREEEDAETPM